MKITLFVVFAVLIAVASGLWYGHKEKRQSKQANKQVQRQNEEKTLSKLRRLNLPYLYDDCAEALFSCLTEKKREKERGLIDPGFEPISTQIRVQEAKEECCAELEELCASSEFCHEDAYTGPYEIDSVDIEPTPVDGLPVYDYCAETLESCFYEKWNAEIDPGYDITLEDRLREECCVEHEEECPVSCYESAYTGPYEIDPVDIEPTPVDGLTVYDDCEEALISCRDRKMSGMIDPHMELGVEQRIKEECCAELGEICIRSEECLDIAMVDANER